MIKNKFVKIKKEINLLRVNFENGMTIKGSHIDVTISIDGHAVGQQMILGTILA